MDERQSAGARAGEAAIRRALVRSLALAAALAAAGAAWYLASRGQEPPAPVEPAIVTGPVPTPVPAADGPPALPFTDITEQAGIDFVHVNGAYGERLMPETIGSGAAFLDYDNDGDPDLYLVGSTYWSGHEGAQRPRQALYRNDGGGRFSDVSAAAGVAAEYYGMGVAVGDYDGDGWVDLFLSNLGENRLLRNVGGRFEDVTARAGVAGRAVDWSTGATFVDYDRDGDLDLYVGNYVKWSREIDLAIDFRLTGLGRAYGDPGHFTGAHPYLYRNEGDGSFVDVSRAAGVQVEDAGGAPVAKTLMVVPLDYDDDGWTDLFVANDTVRNLLFRNRGDGTFEEVGQFEGIAYDRNGKATGAMGSDVAHYRNDADFGIAVGNFANEMSSLFASADGAMPFADEAALEGIGPATRLALTFGVLFLDADLDGWLDLFQANGHLEPEINTVQPSQHYAQPAQLFWNCADCRRRFVAVEEGGDLARPLVGRGAAYADIDGDGDLDLLVTQNGRRPVLLRNDQARGHHWLRVRLRQDGANRDALGATVTLRAGATVQHRYVNPSRGFLSQIELPLTFGLGAEDRVDALDIRWPDGQRQTVAVGAVDRLVTVQRASP